MPGPNKPKKSREKLSSKTTTRKIQRPRNLQQFLALSSTKQDDLIRATQVVSKMRGERISLAEASEQFSISPKHVLQLVGHALRKQKNGRYRATKTDNLFRVLIIPSDNGLTEVAVRGSKEATVIAKYNDAVQKFLRTGDDSQLSVFRSHRLNDTTGRPIQFLVDTKVLTRLGSAGIFSFESLYARSAR